MVPKDIYSDNCVVVFGICTLQDFVVSMLFVIQSVQAFEDEFEQCAKVFR